MEMFNSILDKINVTSGDFSLGGALGLWDIRRNKIIAVPIYLIYTRQAQDKALINHINKRIAKIKNQIEKIEDYFISKGFNMLDTPNLEKKIDDESVFKLSRNILDDRDIVIGLREHLRSVLSLETEALRNTTVLEANKIIYKILHDDNKVFSEILKFQTGKNWEDFPPVIASVDKEPISQATN